MTEVAITGQTLFFVLGAPMPTQLHVWQAEEAARAIRSVDTGLSPLWSGGSATGSAPIQKEHLRGASVFTPVTGTGDVGRGGHRTSRIYCLGTLAVCPGVVPKFCREPLRKAGKLLAARLPHPRLAPEGRVAGKT